MNRKDLQYLADLRIKEAKVLLDNKCYEGAYYLAGYAVECALKACFAKQIQKHEFPDKKMVNDSYTHNLEKLLEVAGLKNEFQGEIQKNSMLFDNWLIIQDWSEQARYLSAISEQKAQNIIAAITDQQSGVLRWLKKLW